MDRSKFLFEATVAKKRRVSAKGSPAVALNTWLMNAFKMRPKMAFDYLKKRGGQMALSWRWQDFSAEMHNKAFTVAKVMEADALQDLHDELMKARKEGTQLKDFKKSVIERLTSRGWIEGEKEQTNPLTGETKTVKMASRLTTIYNTNLQIAFANGRYKQQELLANEYPVGIYKQVQRKTKDPNHAKFHNRAFLLSDPIWKVILPPTRWNCKCTRYTITKDEAERRGITIETGSSHYGFLIENLASFPINLGKTWKPETDKYVKGIKKELDKLLIGRPEVPEMPLPVVPIVSKPEPKPVPKPEPVAKPEPKPEPVVPENEALDQKARRLAKTNEHAALWIECQEQIKELEKEYERIENKERAPAVVLQIKIKDLRKAMEYNAVGMDNPRLVMPASVIRHLAKQNEKFYKDLQEEGVYYANTYNKAQEIKDRIMDKTMYTIRIKSTKFLQVLSSGRFKSQFETKSSGGALAPGYRARTEKLMFDYKEELDPKNRPIYGYAYDKSNPGSADWYGDVRVYLKKDTMKYKTTVTFGDSLDSGYMPAANDDFVKSGCVIRGSTTFSGMEEMVGRNPTDIARFKGQHSYIEFQYHGGVTVEDIDWIEIPASIKDSDTGREIMKICSKHDIAVGTY